VFRHIQELEKSLGERYESESSDGEGTRRCCRPSKKEHEKALAQAEKKYVDALARSKKKHADELARVISGRAKLLGLMHAKTQRQKAILSHVKQALNKRHKNALEHVKEEYTANARALAEKEHRTQLESVVQDALSLAKE
jgi:hypothetical protein